MEASGTTTVSENSCTGYELAQEKEFNLPSNVFMTVVLKDIRAWQHVLRIAIGIKNLMVKEVRI